MIKFPERKNVNRSFFFIFLFLFTTSIVSAEIIENPIKEEFFEPVQESYYDQYCTEKGLKTTCLVQTQKDNTFPCTIQNGNIICERTDSLKVMTWYSTLATSKEITNKEIIKMYDDYGVPFKLNNKVIGYLRFKEKETFYTKDFNVNDKITIGFDTNTFVIQDFYYGSGENVSIDVGVELSPTDKDVVLPQSDNLVVRLDFVDGTEDTSGSNLNATVDNAIHKYERYVFDGDGDEINIPANNIFQPTNITINTWFNYDQNDSGNINVLVNTGTMGGPIFGYTLWINGGTIQGFFGNGTIRNVMVGANVKDSKWHMATIKYNGSHQFLYLDSVLQDSDPWNIIAYNNVELRIGSASASIYFNGSLENVYIWNQSLSQTEIETIYNQTRFNTSGNTQTYSGLFTGGTLNTENYYTNYFNLTWNSIEPTGTDINIKYRLGEYINNFNQINNLVSLWKMNRSDATNIMQNSSIDDNIVLHMKFNNETDFYDYSGQGNNGTNQGSAYNNKGYIGGARSFDGVNDYVDCGNDLSLNFTENITVSTWINTENMFTGGANVVGTIVAKGSPYYANLVGWSMYHSWGQIFFTTSNVTNIISANAAGVLKLNKWQNVVGTINSTTISIYVDGDLKGSKAIQGSIQNYDTDVLIGRELASASGYHHFNGKIDNVRIYNNSLNTTQVKKLYSKEAGTYDEKNQNNGIAIGTDRSSGIFEKDGALSFDGVNDYVDVGTISLGTANLTLNVWAKSKNDLNTATITNIGGNDFRIYLSSGKTLRCYYGTQQYNTAFVPSLNDWHMFTLTFNGTNVSLYSDAVKKGEWPDTPFNVAGASYIGSFSDAIQFFNGTIDVVAIYDRALSQIEINSLYANWSGWSNYSNTSPINIQNMGKPLLNYQAKLSTNNNSNTPRLTNLNVTYDLGAWLINISIKDYGLEWISMNWTWNPRETERNAIIQYSTDNLNWKEMDYINQTTKISYIYNLQKDTLYYFKCKGDSGVDGIVYLSQRTLGGEYKMISFLILAIAITVILLILGIIVENSIFMIISGVLFIIDGLMLITINFSGIESKFSIGIGLILTVLGVFISIIAFKRGGE